jgi:molybdopterin synthase sulfur carrier subunit
MSEISVVVKLFAAYRECLGREEIHLTLSGPTTVGAVLETILAAHPELKPWQPLTRLGVNLQFVTADTWLMDGDEVVLIPPVSGGKRS